MAGLITTPTPLALERMKATDTHTFVFGGRELELTAWAGSDGAIVVQLDSNEATGHVRVVLNEGILFNADPDAEEVA